MNRGQNQQRGFGRNLSLLEKTWKRAVINITETYEQTNSAYLHIQILITEQVAGCHQYNPTLNHQMVQATPNILQDIVGVCV